MDETASFLGILASAKEHALVDTHRGASEKDLKVLLRILRMKLPKNYLAFLREVGWLDMNGDVIYGEGPDVTKTESVAYQSAYATVHYMVRSTYLPISSDGGGGFFCLDINRISGNDCPVVFWDTAVPDPEFHTPPEEAPSFAAYLERLLDELPEL